MRTKRLLLPKGLHRQKLCRLTNGPGLQDDILGKPTALLHREPVPCTVYVTVRNAEQHADADIVDGIYEEPGPGRVELRQILDPQGQFRLVCKPYSNVSVLNLFNNLDILARCAALMSAGIILLTLDEPKADSQNLNPLVEFFTWWLNPDNSLPDKTDWTEIAPGARAEFEGRQAHIDDQRTSNSHFPIVVPLPRCFQDLERELLYDENLSQAIVSGLSRQRDVLAPFITDRDLVEPELAARAMSVFRNSEKYLKLAIRGVAARRAAKQDRSGRAKRDRAANTDPNLPNWFGIVFRSALPSARRLFLNAANVRRPPQLPNKQCRQMVESLGVNLETWDLDIESLVVEYLSTLKAGDKPDKALGSYYEAKMEKALSIDYLAQQAVAKFTSDGPNPKSLRICRTEMLRTMDFWCAMSAVMANAGRRPPGFFFRAFFNGVMRAVLVSSTPTPELRAIHDLEILDKLSLALPLQPQNFPLAPVNLQGPDSTLREILSDEEFATTVKRLRSIIKFARLPDDETLAVLYYYEIVYDSWTMENKQAVCNSFGVQWESFPEEDLSRLHTRALRKLKASEAKRLPVEGLAFLMRESELSEAQRRAVLSRYDILRNDLDMSEKNTVRNLFGIDSYIPVVLSKGAEAVAFAEIDRARNRLQRTGRLRELIDRASLDAREIQIVLVALGILKSKMTKPQMDMIRKRFDVEPQFPVVDEEELELLRKRTFRKLHAGLEGGDRSA